MSSRGSQLVKTVFNLENPFMRACEKVLDLVSVNLLFLLSCLPIITIGIAKISLYATVSEMKRSRRVRIFSTYRRAFQKHWKQGLVLGVLELMVLGICVMNLLLFRGQDQILFQLIKLLSVAMLFLLVLQTLALYPVAARYQMDIVPLLQTSFLLVSFHFPWFFLMVAILFICAFVLSSSLLALLLGLSVLILAGCSSLACLQMEVMDQLFKKWE